MGIPMYMAASEDVSTDINFNAWWKRHAIEFPKWANAFIKLSLVQQLSAAAERVLSSLQRFTVQQQSSLEDYIELSVMLQFNFARPISKKNFFQLFMFKITLVGKSCCSCCFFLGILILT